MSCNSKAVVACSLVKLVDSSDLVHRASRRWAMSFTREIRVVAKQGRASRDILNKDREDLMETSNMGLVEEEE